MIRKFSVLLYWAVILALTVLFFTNDFGIVDVHKTAIIVAVGIDSGEEVQVTAQLAIPKPSQSGENIEYTQIQGSGETVADALNEINVKTGFYPKLQFCKLILIGEECKSEELFRLLGCFYRKNYSELTALVAMCKGTAADMLSQPTAASDMNSTAIQRALSPELEKSGNVSSVNLKDIALTNFSESSACYMPFIEATVQGTSQNGGDGEAVGGEQPPPENTEGGGGSGGQGGGSTQSSGEGGGGGSGGGKPVDFTASKTAVFSGGRFAGVLDVNQAFALNVIKSDVRLASLSCDAAGRHYTLGLRKAKGKLKLKVSGGVPVLKISFRAYAQIAGIKKVVDPAETDNDDLLSAEVIEGAEREVRSRFEDLVAACVREDCDVLGVKQLIFKHEYKAYGALKDSALQKLKVEYDIKIKSAS